MRWAICMCTMKPWKPYPVVIAEGDLRTAVYDDAKAFYRVEKMKFGGKGKDKDKTTVHYNAHITMTGIPLEAYDYVVNGKPALSWVMERQSVKVDKASGIVNDANAYANETVGNPRVSIGVVPAGDYGEFGNDEDCEWVASVGY